MAIKNKFIELEDIDTSTAEENFSTLLKEKKTYFLNGSWGSGKTTFLKNVDEKYDEKLLFIDLWQINDSRPLLEIVFSKFHPVYYWGFLALTIILVSISILSTNVVNLGLEQYFGMIPKISMWVGIIALVVAVCQFFKFKTDIFYAWLLRCIPFGKKVLIIDDFDRLTEKQQEETYKIFSLLKGKLPIVFVVDISKIYTVKDNFLSKIIDRRVELSFVLHPQNIWEQYFKTLEEKLQTTISQDFKKLVVWEGRNLRDREHFNDYVNKEFFERNKLDHVQTNQQLLIIYIYLFHQHHYQNLLNGVNIKETESTSKQSIGYHIRKLNKYNDDYPVCFAKSKTNYFLYEETTNLTSSELEMILSTDLENVIQSKSNSDIYQYFISKYNTMPLKRKNDFLEIAVKHIKANSKSDVISYIINSKQNEIIEKVKNQEREKNSGALFIARDEANLSFFTEWSDIIKPLEFDLSQMLYFFICYNIISFDGLGKICSNMDIDDSFFNSKRKDILLMVYISSKDIWNKFYEWDENIWNFVAQLNDNEFISFWILQNIISNGKDFEEFDFRPDDKNYIIWTERYGVEDGKKISFEDSVIKKIENRLNQLEEKGYKFSRQTDEKYKRD